MKPFILAALGVLSWCQAASAGPLGIFRFGWYGGGYEPVYYSAPITETPCCCDAPQQTYLSTGEPAEFVAPTEFITPTTEELQWLQIERQRRERRDGMREGGRRGNEQHKMRK